MKRLIYIVVMVLALASTAIADERVRGHWKDTDRDGIKDTYVEPYHRTEKNNSALDNYGTKGNTNPYTGKEGTINPYKNAQPSPFDYNPYRR